MIAVLLRMMTMFLGSGGTLHSAMMFILKLGWQVRYHLPILLIPVLLPLDYRFHHEREIVDNAEPHNHL